jgi:hypothetical protein
VRGRLHGPLPPWFYPWFALNNPWDASTLQLQAPLTQDMSRHFSTYNSPLSSFASFRSASQLDGFSTVDTSFSSTLTSPMPLLSVDTPVSLQLPTLLRPLKEATLLKLDPKRAICQFEIPGAGKCRDSTCTNVHLRAFEPNGEFTYPCRPFCSLYRNPCSSPTLLHPPCAFRPHLQMTKQRAILRRLFLRHSRPRRKSKRPYRVFARPPNKSCIWKPAFLRR